MNQGFCAAGCDEMVAQRRARRVLAVGEEDRAMRRQALDNPGHQLGVVGMGRIVADAPDAGATGTTSPKTLTDFLADRMIWPSVPGAW